MLKMILLPLSGLYHDIEPGRAARSTNIAYVMSELNNYYEKARGKRAVSLWIALSK
jgi:hypothetical protein